ncbi:MAG TPA: hypothetical protein VMG10_05355 [Gemmataceae bacterium]|nr:hypothetical protein [Gemmataceae bacterium]
MSGRNLSAVARVVLALSVLLLGMGQAMAYVGPGADLSFVGYAMTLFLWVAAAFSTVLLWPVYALLRRIRGGKKKSATASRIETASGEARAGSRAEP